MMQDQHRLQTLDEIANRIESLHYAPYRSMVVCGPPRCGKSLMANEIARRLDFQYVDFLAEVLSELEPASLETYDRTELLTYMRVTITRLNTGTVFDELEGLFATWRSSEVHAFFGNLRHLKVGFPCVVVTTQELDTATLQFDPDRVYRLR